MTTNNGLYTSNTAEWATPQDFYNYLNGRFDFTLDPCSTDANAKCEKHYTKADDGLSKSWDGEIVFCNPPYGRGIGKWVKKCFDEWWCNNATVVALLPARTDTKWFHSFIYGVARIEFVKGRLHFNESKNSAPFPSMVVIWEGEIEI